MNTSKLFYRFQQLLILVAHLVLLGWMYYALSESGHLSMQTVLLHFVGMAIYGALLIRGTALWAKHHYNKENEKQ